MLKLLQIFLLMGLSVAVFPNTKPDNFRISIPEFIPKGKPFEAILTTSKVFEDSDELDVYIITGSALFLNEAELWTKEGKTKLAIGSVLLNKFAASAYNISIDLTSSNISEIERYFQILLSFSPLGLQETKLKLYGEFKRDGKVIGYFENYATNSITNDENLYEFRVRTFEKYQIAGKSAVFNQNSSLKIPLNYRLDGKLVIDFWVKHLSFGHSYFKLIDEQSNKIEFSLELNEYQMLCTTSGYHELTSIKPKFISKNAWYHINIVISDVGPFINFYCNDEEISRVKLLYKLNLENVSIEFFNATISPSINLEQLRLFNLYASVESILQNKNFKNFTADSSRILLQLNFEISELNSLKNSDKIFYSNLKFVNSDAPIFPRAPEINLKVLNNYYEIGWTGGDFTNAANYILERAVGDGNFVEVAKQDADRKSAKIYTQLSEKTNQPEIVYYRVKQINLDKTEVYSEIFKVGQGIVEDVILEQNYPNPFNPKTQIEFELVQDSDVEVVVYNLAGKEVALLHRGFLSQGTYKFKFDGSELPSGIYLFQVVTSQSTQTRKMILAK
jgi:hypothetical protein